MSVRPATGKELIEQIGMTEWLVVFRQTLVITLETQECSTWLTNLERMAHWKETRDWRTLTLTGRDTSEGQTTNYLLRTGIQNLW